jgi:hypothetical protein
MTEELDINKLILETINSLCKDNPAVLKLIRSSINYELDIWNRIIQPSEIDGNYDIRVNKIIKERSA